MNAEVLNNLISRIQGGGSSSELVERVEEVEGDMNTLISSVQYLGTVVNTLGASVNALASHVQSLATRVSALEVGGGGSDLSALEARVEKLENEIHPQLVTLTGRITAVESSVGGIDGTFDDLRSKIKTIDNQISYLNRQIDYNDGKIFDLTEKYSGILSEVESNTQKIIPLQAQVEQCAIIKMDQLPGTTDGEGQIAYNFLSFPDDIQTLPDPSNNYNAESILGFVTNNKLYPQTTDTLSVSWVTTPVRSIYGSGYVPGILVKFNWIYSSGQPGAPADGLNVWMVYKARNTL